MIAKFFSRGRKQHARRVREIARRQTAERQRSYGGERLEGRQLLANTVGVITNNVAEAFGGYTLFAPSLSTTTYLIDQEGHEVNRWTSDYTPLTAELLPDGSMIRAARVPTQGGPNKQWAPGTTGRIEKFNWDGDLVWSYTLATQDAHLHHDFEVMPNGNVLMIAWERKTYAEAVAAGRDPNDVPIAPGTGGVRELWPDMLIEVRPNQPAEGQSYAEGGEIVWRWHLWDHLVQDIDPTKDNYGPIAANPQLVDINYYLTGDGMGGVPADWTHFNSVDYNPELDQIVVSPREFGELWIIDRSTTTAEAAGRTGGRAGRGGSLLYRWGNPAAYKSGTAADQKLFYQHDPQWIRPGLPGAGNMLVFNNGWNPNPSLPSYSSVLEITLPANTAQWYLSDTRSSSVAAAAAFNTGIVPATWAQLSGDWDGDGNDSIGYYDPAARTFRLYDSANDTIPATIDASGIAAAGWVPLAGDWDGDGTTTVGFYDPATGRFRLSNATNAFATDAASGLVEFTASLPNGRRLPAGVRPIVGDWNADGTDNVGVYNPADNMFRLNAANDRWLQPRQGLIVFRPNLPYLLPPRWLPVTGDWDGDGRDTTGLYDPARRTWYLNNRVNGSTTAVFTVTTAYAAPSWRPVTGDWNGDGVDTIGLFNPGFAEAGYAKPGRAFGPSSPTWRYVATPRQSFYARIISGMQRLPNGNTLINEGTEGRFFEVTPAGRIVWEYINPVIGPNPANVLYQGQRPQIAPIGIPGTYQNFTFRAQRYAADYPGLAGRDLTPGNPIERYAEGADTIGRFSPTDSRGQLNNRNIGSNTGVVQAPVPKLAGAWRWVAGDWNGPDGSNVRRDSLGAYNAVTRRFRLYPENAAAQVIAFSAPADVPTDAVPVAGDFNGDGIDTVSLFAPSLGRWYINNNATGWTTAATFAVGAVPAYVRPLAGDWDGDGVDGIAVYDPFEKKLYLNNRADGDRSSEQQVTFAWAGTNWLALAGDWDGDGRTSIGFVNPANSSWRLSNRLDGTTTDLSVFTWSLPVGWQPLAGNWNGRGGISS
jgi:hypothetical protein